MAESYYAAVHASRRSAKAARRLVVERAVEDVAPTRRVVLDPPTPQLVAQDEAQQRGIAQR